MRPSIKKGVLMLAAAIYVLVFGELFVRYLKPVALMPRFITAAPYGIRMNQPNVSYWQTTPETRVQVRMNSRGIRADREYDYSRRPGACRIVVFGDSLLLGYEVDLEDSFTWLVERELEKRGRPCDVVNLSVSGFGTAEMLVALENEGLKYQPDLVVFGWHYTDLENNVRAGLFRLDDESRLTTARKEFLPAVGVRDWLSQFRAYRWLIQNSQLYTVIRDVLARQYKRVAGGSLLPRSVQKRRQQRMAGKREERAGVRSDFEERLSLALLRRAKEVSHRNGSRFAVLEIPSRDPVTGRLYSSFPAAGDDVRSDLNVLSSIEVLADSVAAGDKVFYEKGHGHLNPLGNRWLALYFVDAIADQSLLTADIEPAFHPGAVEAGDP